MRRQEIVDGTFEPHAAGGEDDEVIADALDVREQVRRQDDRGAVLGDSLHHVAEELPPGQRIETRHGFVEEQEFGTRCHGQGQRELRPLTTRQTPRTLTLIQAELGDSKIGKLSVPTRVTPLPQTQVIPDTERPVDGRILSEEPDARELIGAGARPTIEHADRSFGRFE